MASRTGGKKTAAAALLVALAVLSGGAVVLRREITALVRDVFSPVPAETVSRLRTRIHQLRIARAEEVAAAIKGTLAIRMPGEAPDGHDALVVPHVGTNSLIIQAHPEKYARIVEMVAELDAPPR